MLGIVRYKQLLNNTNYGIGIINDSMIHYKSDGSNYETDYSDGYIQTISTGGSTTLNYSSTQNGVPYLTTSVNASTGFVSYNNANIPRLTNSYTMIMVNRYNSADNLLLRHNYPTGTGATAFGMRRVQMNTSPNRVVAGWNNRNIFNQDTGGITLIAYNPNSSEYTPASWFITVYKQTYVPGEYSNTISQYLTCNGRGSSGGANYVAGSFTNTSPTYAGTSNLASLQTVSISYPGTSYRGELLIWDRELEIYEVNAVENMLKTKWGITY